MTGITPGSVNSYAEEDIYYTVTYTIWVNSTEILTFDVDFHEGSEIDSEVSSSGEYEFEAGMTWSEWEGISYNTVGAWFDEQDYENHLWFGDGGHYISVVKTELINADSTYDALIY